jgi:hypothetical protein
MLQVVMSVFLALVAMGCGGQRYVDYFPCHDDGTPKPKLALMPILDSTQCSLPWDLTEEIADGIYYELMNSGEIYMVSAKEMGPGWMKRDSIDFFSNDYSYAADFNNTDFIVSMEIIERSIVACDPCTPSNLTLTMRIRIKILDVRFCEPKVVLYEVFKTSFSGIQINGNIENGIYWKDENYSKTLCGRGHQRIICILTKRLEEVIWSLK